MQKIIKSDERGKNEISWLKSWHTFSFGDYHNRENMLFGSCRVINDDYVLGGGGFHPHGHRDMEIVTYILSGALEHADSMGTSSVIKRGDIQRMSAGSGITHSEFNHSKTETVHLLQIWFFPRVKNIVPTYAQKNFSDEQKENKLLLIAAENGRDEAITLNQDVDIYASILKDVGTKLKHILKTGRKAWLHVASGNLIVNGTAFGTGDGIGFSAEKDDIEIEISLDSKAESSKNSENTQAEFLIFDMG